MKELNLQDLLNMADASAHDGIGDLWNQKAIHYLVIFTSENEDFEIIGVGPTLPCATLDDAGQHAVPGKTAEYYVKCPAAIAGRLQPRLAPAHLGIRPAPARPTAEAATSMKGRTVIPFQRPPLTLSAKTPEKVAEVAEMPKAEEVKPKLLGLKPAAGSNVAPAPSPPPAPASLSPATPGAAADLATRERAIAQREQELSALAASLKIREAALRAREDAVIASEERLLKPTPKPG